MSKKAPVLDPNQVTQDQFQAFMDCPGNAALIVLIDKWVCGRLEAGDVQGINSFFKAVTIILGVASRCLRQEFEDIPGDDERWN